MKITQGLSHLSWLICCSWDIRVNHSSNSVYFVLPNITNYGLASEGFTVLTHRHPWPLTSHRIRKNSQKIEEKNRSQIKEINLQESNRGESLSRMDRWIDVMWPEGQIRVKTHSRSMTECMNTMTLCTKHYIICKNLILKLVFLCIEQKDPDVSSHPSTYISPNLFTLQVCMSLTRL